MKTHYNFLFIIITILISFTTVTHSSGQILKPQRKKADNLKCDISQITAKVVIQHENYARLYFKVSNTSSDNFIIKSTDNDFKKQINIKDNEVIIDLPKGKTYELISFDNCGNQASIGSTNTGSIDNGEKGIGLSLELYSAIVEYQKMEKKIPLIDFLKTKSELSLFERVSFIQEYLFKGTSLDDEISEHDYLNNLNSESFSGVTCDCQFIYVTKEFIRPGLQINGTIKLHHESSETNFNNDSKWWDYRNTEGPAKFHGLYSTGHKAGGTDRSIVYDEMLSGDPPTKMNTGLLMFNLFCSNGGSTSDCRCKKRVRVYYGYDTNVYSLAEKRPGVLTRRANSLSRDNTIVALRIENEIEILDGLSIEVKSNCNSSFPVIPGINLWKPISEYYKVIQSVGTNPLVLEANIKDGIEDLDLELESFEVGCGTKNEKTRSVYDFIDFDLPANTEAFLNIFSFTQQTTRGKRAWRSEATVGSNFSLLGITSSGRIEGGDEACCTNKIGNWIFASAEGPLTDNDIKKELGIRFWQNGTWELLLNTPSNTGYAIPSDYGRTENKDGKCDEIPPLGFTSDPPTITEYNNFNNELDQISEIISKNKVKDEKENNQIINSPEKILNLSKKEFKEIIVFDLYGRVIFRDSRIPSDNIKLEDFLRQKQLIKQTGIYFIRFSYNNSYEIHKVFIQK